VSEILPGARRVGRLKRVYGLERALQPHAVLRAGEGSNLPSLPARRINRERGSEETVPGCAVRLTSVLATSSHSKEGKE